MQSKRKCGLRCEIRVSGLILNFVTILLMWSVEFTVGGCGGGDIFMSTPTFVLLD